MTFVKDAVDLDRFDKMPSIALSVVLPPPIASPVFPIIALTGR